MSPSTGAERGGERPLAAFSTLAASPTLSLGPATTVVARGADVASYDLAGRPYALVRGDLTWRRSLNGALLLKGLRDGRRVRERHPPEAGAAAFDAARRDVAHLVEALASSDELAPATRAEAERRLRRIVAMDGPALARDAAAFDAIYRPIGILPPDQYLALVLQLTEGCSWNQCTFCELYRATPFHAKSVAELDEHIDQLRAFFGESIALRRSVFLGDANALCLSHERLLPLIERVAREFPVRPAGLQRAERESWRGAHPTGTSGLFAFVDAWTGQRKGTAEYAAYARLGLRRVYVGLESGDAALLEWLGKPGGPDDALGLVEALHGAGVAVGVIVLIGAGGEAFYAAHAERTAQTLARMHLVGRDLLYFSELVEHPTGAYAARAARDVITPLVPERCAEQRAAILSACRAADPSFAPRVSNYDIREFIY